MPVDETKPFLIFLRPPPGVRAHTPNTPQAGHLAAHSEIPVDPARRVAGVRLLDYGQDRFGAQDAWHWTGYWHSPREALEALRRLQALNAPRIAAWQRIRLVKGAAAAAEAAGGPLAGLLAEQLAKTALAALTRVQPALAVASAPATKGKNP